MGKVRDADDGAQDACPTSPEGSVSMTLFSLHKGIEQIGSAYQSTVVNPIADIQSEILSMGGAIPGPDSVRYRRSARNASKARSPSHVTDHCQTNHIHEALPVAGSWSAADTRHGMSHASANTAQPSSHQKQAMYQRYMSLNMVHAMATLWNVHAMTEKRTRKYRSAEQLKPCKTGRTFQRGRPVQHVGEAQHDTKSQNGRGGRGPRSRRVNG